MNPSEVNGPRSTRPRAAVVIAWFLVIVPLLWGVWQTVKKASALFQ